MIDKSYLENLVFRLNHEIEAGHRVGNELTEPCSKFSVETISKTLKFFLSGIKKTKGIERNLIAKKFLEKIFYSPETIKLRLILPQSGGEAAANASPAQLSAGRGERTSSSGNFEFVSYDFAARPGIEPRFTASKAAVLPLDDLAIE